ncbi:sugar MFS transporter [Planctobacterium marinum]|uniref:sugar MFS transporter n=1 Tax=Planctobacterium marinum TaxID=1631968 RepID=UPI001E623DAC|nr:sugar MFS transporter [Planctobacterium marinum]MCC2606068.1 sugar MFS transporter [Planctobacterium marinum]
MTSNCETQSMPETKSSLIPMLIIGTLFFVFGFVTWLNGALIPFLQMVCQLSETQALMVAFCFYVAYVVMALPMAMVLEKTGYRMGMVIGLGLIALGALLFVPAALSREFALFLGAQFIMGSGLTILQTASNPYIVKIGPEESAAARIAVMGLLNKAAGVLAPLLFTALVLGDFAHITSSALESMSEADRLSQIEMMSTGLVTPYIGMAVVLVLLAIGLKMSSLPEISLNDAQEESSTSTDSVLHYPQLVLGAVALFFYVGVEVIAGDTIGLYGSKLGIANATSLTSLTMFGMVAGYLAGLVLIPRFLKQQQALLISAILGLVLTAMILFADVEQQNFSFLWAWAGFEGVPDVITCVALLGLANAMVWPALWPLALAGLGKLTSKGSAILIMGIAGGAVMPLGYGLLSDSWDSQSAYVIMLPCYLFILFYALVGYRLRQWR